MADRMEAQPAVAAQAPHDALAEIKAMALWLDELRQRSPSRERRADYQAE